MLIEFWERLRGYDKWTETAATVQSSTLDNFRFGSESEKQAGRGQPLVWQSVCKIEWKDHHDNQFTATFEAFEESPLYQLRAGDTVTIRFNPQRPAEFYLRGLLKSDLAYSWKIGVYTIMLVLVFVAIFGLWFSPAILRVVFH
jgi:hypothetical protein